MLDRGQPSTRFTRATQRLRWPMLVLICLLGAAVTLAMAHSVRQSQKRVLRLTFLDDVDENLMLISQSVEGGLEQLRTLGVFIRSAKRVDRHEFARFVLPTLRRHPTLHGLAWVPRIPAQERETFERAASVGLDRPYRIVESLDDRLRPAGDRAVYYPVTFAEPIEQLSSVLGLDLGAEPSRRKSLEQAVETGRLVVTPAVAFADKVLGAGSTASDATTADARRLGVIAFLPIYRGEEPPTTAAERREQLLGLVAAGFLVSSVVENPQSYWKQPDLQVYLFDRSMPEGRQLVYARHGTPPRDLTVAGVIDDANLEAMRALTVGGREWLLVSTPTAEYMRSARSVEPWVVLLVGLTLTGLVALVLGGMIRSADRIAEFAAGREAANLALRERIREREEAEEALESANRELRQVNADMERFVGAVSHDLKSPLVAAEMLMSVMTQAVARRDMDRVAHTSAQIAKACGRMRRIIDDLLEHQKAGWSDLRSTAVDMVEVALHVIEEHRDEAAERGVHVQLQDDLPTLRADRGRITALLDNLVGNALKYGSNGADPVVTIGAETVDGEVRLFVRDTGPGIPEEDRDRMWELFQRLSRDEEGTGIGLAIVRRVAEAHGGRAWVECPPPPPQGPGGSIFWIALPADRLIKSEPRATAQVG